MRGRVSRERRSGAGKPRGRRVCGPVAAGFVPVRAGLPRRAFLGDRKDTARAARGTWIVRASPVPEATPMRRDQYTAGWSGNVRQLVETAVSSGTSSGATPSSSQVSLLRKRCCSWRRSTISTYADGNRRHLQNGGGLPARATARVAPTGHAGRARRGRACPVPQGTSKSRDPSNAGPVASAGDGAPAGAKGSPLLRTGGLKA